MKSARNRAIPTRAMPRNSNRGQCDAAAMDPMQDIARAVRLLAESEDPAALQVAAALEAWRRSAEISFEEALGRAPSWRAAWRRRRRDEALHRLTLQFANLSDQALADNVQEVVNRYETSAAWRRDRDSGHRPDGVDGLAFVLIHGEPPGREHLRKAFGRHQRWGLAHR
jgi:hypothetical protein